VRLKAVAVPMPNISGVSLALSRSLSRVRRARSRHLRSVTWGAIKLTDEIAFDVCHRCQSKPCQSHHYRRLTQVFRPHVQADCASPSITDLPGTAADLHYGSNIVQTVSVVNA